MGFTIREAKPGDLPGLVRLATSLSAQGFLTLPTAKGEMEGMIALSESSFGGNLSDRDEGKYLFVLAEADQPIGCSLIVARHGTPESPHLYLQVDSRRRTLRLCQETTGRTELGGLILEPTYRGRPERLGKGLSYARLLYSGCHPDRFRPEIVAELLPPFLPDGRSPLWEALGRKFTGLGYREADERSRRDKQFVARAFPHDEIPIDSLPREARAVIGQVGPETAPVAKILEVVGFRYLDQVDPFDGGPHYGARQTDLRGEVISKFFAENPVRVEVP